jgi:hypothetical protein
MFRLGRSHRSDEPYDSEPHALRAFGGDASFDNPRTFLPLTWSAKRLAVVPLRAKAAPQYRVEDESREEGPDWILSDHLASI